jgi:uncharacterized protein YbaR (Trm112 family)
MVRWLSCNYGLQLNLRSCENFDQTLMLNQKILSLLRCSECRNGILDVVSDSSHLQCRMCGSMFPLVDEIPILLPRKLINHQPVGEGVKAPEFETSDPTSYKYNQMEFYRQYYLSDDWRFGVIFRCCGNSYPMR